MDILLTTRPARAYHPDRAVCGRSGSTGMPSAATPSPAPTSSFSAASTWNGRSKRTCATRASRCSSCASPPGVLFSPMNRSMFALLGTIALAACGDLGVPGGRGAVGVSPVLDSVFVGDRLPPRRVLYVTPNGNPASPGQVIWASSDTAIAWIDSLSGGITGRKRGAALITARAQGLTGLALIVVSDTLDITLLLDTVYVLPGDTMTVPVVVLKSNEPPPATVWFKAPSNSAYSIDSASGRITALAPGGPIPCIVHADSLADTGAVYVMHLADTTGGKIFYSVSGTAITHVGGPAHAANFVATSGRRAFQLTGTFAPNGVTTQRIKITQPDSVISAGVYAIDSVSPDEDPFSSPATCAAPRPWAVWSALNPSIDGFSRRGGTLVVIQICNLPHAHAVTG